MGGPPLPADLSVEVTEWQRGVRILQASWYAGVAPPAVSAVFVLQWLLQLPAHAAAFAAVLGPWRVRALERLTFALGPSLVPAVLRLEGLDVAAGDVGSRLDTAESDYRRVAEPLAARYTAAVRIGPHTRAALVDDMWAAALTDAESAAEGLRLPPPDRASCCLMYALPGCTECAGCPRIRPRTA